MKLPDLDNIDVIYLDMDGVIVDLLYGVSNLLDIDPDEIRAHDGGFGGAWARKTGMTDERAAESAVWNMIRGAGADFWRDLPWTDYGTALFIAAATARPTAILSSPADGTSAAGKIEWLRKHRKELRAIYKGTGFAYRKPEHRRFALSPSKELFAHSHALLIDDHDKNTDAFQRAGGHAVTWPRPWNSSTHTEKGIIAWLAAGCEGLW